MGIGSKDSWSRPTVLSRVGVVQKIHCKVGRGIGGKNNSGRGMRWVRGQPPTTFSELRGSQCFIGVIHAITVSYTHLTLPTNREV